MLFTEKQLDDLDNGWEKNDLGEDCPEAKLPLTEAWLRDLKRFKSCPRGKDRKSVLIESGGQVFLTRGKELDEDRCWRKGLLKDEKDESSLLGDVNLVLLECQLERESLQSKQRTDSARELNDGNEEFDDRE